MKMVYNIREYETMYTGNKGSEENAIVAIIMNLLNNNKFDSIDDALKYNGNDFNTFMKNNRRDNIPSHYGRNIKDSDFKSIVENFKKMVDKKLSFDKENVHEVKFDNNKEYVEYNGQVVDNSLKERSIEDDLKYIQQENPDYQTLNEQENTDRMMHGDVIERKREVKFTSLDNIEREKLNSEDKQIYDAALIDQHLNNTDKEISIEDRLTKSDDNSINQLKEEGNGISITSNDEDIEVQNTTINPLSSINKSELTSIQQEVYDAAEKYQEITGELIRLDLENMLIITPYNEVKEIITKNGVLVVDDPRILSQDSMTNEEEKEQEMEMAKVKKLEYPSPFNRYNNTEEAA